MKVVLDTNVLMAAFGSRGLCEMLYQRCLADHEIIVCRQILEELREHLQDKLEMSPAASAAIVHFVEHKSTLAEPVAVAPGACRDPDDLMVLGTALATKADAIVTGDRDLLVLGKFGSIPILSPRQFHDQIK